MEYKDFYDASQNLKKFQNEQDKLYAVLNVISPSSTGVCEFGSEFIDDYIKVVEICLGDKYGWFSWFVFENDFGKRKLHTKIDDKEYTICDEKDFYEMFMIFKNK